MMSVKSRVITATRRATMQIPVPSQKLALVLATSVLVTDGGKEVVVRVLYIHYPI